MRAEGGGVSTEILSVEKKSGFSEKGKEIKKELFRGVKCVSCVTGRDGAWSQGVVTSDQSERAGRAHVRV